MTSSIKSTSDDGPTFVVGPQSTSENSRPPKQGKQITFKTDQRQYKHSLPTVPSKQNQLRVTHGSTPYSRKIRFADPKTQTGFTPRHFNPDEPPAKRARVTKYGKNHTEPTLSVRKPLKIHVPIDAWQLILQRCDPAFLIKARLVCRDFHDILKRQAPWREARNNYYGDEIPDPPQGISEFRYAVLLVGRGCQVKLCTRKDTRKVYWPFMLRMCEKCLEQGTQKPSLSCEEARSYSQMHQSLEYEVQKTIPTQLPGLLSAGRLKSNRWAGPRPLDADERNWRNQHMSDNTLVLTDDYEALKRDFNDKVTNDPDYFLFWARLKWGETRDRMCKVAELEQIDFGEIARPHDLSEQKMLLFCEKALKLDPPIDIKALQKFVAYHNALNTPNAASLRSWDMLRAKIDVPELRAQAEQLVQWEQTQAEWSSTTESELYERVRKHRRPVELGSLDDYTPEQRVIVDIAYDELEDLLDVVHDEDVLLMWFDRVRRAYESLDHKPNGLRGDGTEGTYSLMLDDALVILQDVLRPMLVECKEGMGQYKRILTSLRCMGCTRLNTATTYDFRGLMDHIRNTHAEYVSKDSNWHRMAVPAKPDRRGKSVAWYRLPWFKTMPALPFHRKAYPGMIWNPDVETEYIQHGGSKPSPITFDVLVAGQTRIPTDDFTSDFCRAVRTLIDTRLPSIFVVKVALDYATRVRNASGKADSSSTKLTIAQLQNLETVCARDTTRLEFKFQCKQCAKEIEESSDNRRPPKIRALSEFVSHCQQKHRTDLDTEVTEQIIFPSESDLMMTIENEDAKLEAEKSSHLKKTARNSELVDPRAAALMATPSIRSCFDKLFTPRVIDEDQT